MFFRLQRHALRPQNDLGGMPGAAFAQPRDLRAGGIERDPIASADTSVVFDADRAVNWQGVCSFMEQTASVLTALGASTRPCMTESR